MKKPSADERAVPAREGSAEVRERASRFLAFAYPVSDPNEAADLVARLRKQYHDATHIAFAWNIGSLIGFRALSGTGGAVFAVSAFAARRCGSIRTTSHASPIRSRTELCGSRRLRRRQEILHWLPARERCERV